MKNIIKICTILLYVYNSSIFSMQPELHKLIEQSADIAEIKKTIQAGADINEEYNFETPLTRAIETGNFETCLYFV